MKVYAVFQEGVYRHLCAGIFDTEEAALACANETAQNDMDDYHTWSVVPFELNAASFAVKHNFKDERYQEPTEADPIYSTSKVR